CAWSGAVAAIVATTTRAKPRIHPGARPSERNNNGYAASGDDGGNGGSEGKIAGKSVITLHGCQRSAWSSHALVVSYIARIATPVHAARVAPPLVMRRS